MSDPLGSVLEVAKANADRAFLISPERGLTLTFGGFHDGARGLACRLESLGVRRGDRVLALLPNSPEYAVLFFACLYLGAAVVPVNPALHPRDVGFIIRSAGAKLLIHSGTKPPADGPALWELPLLGDPLFKLPWRPLRGVEPDDILTIVFTSGTTAFPKAVAHRIGSLVGNARAFNAAMGNGADDRFLHLFPLSYSGGFFNLLIAPYLAGASVVMTPGFGPRSALDFWRLPAAHGVNAMWLSPSMAAALLSVDRDEAGRSWCRRNVRKLFIGTAPLHVNVKRAFESAYGVPLYESYGLSETLLAAACGPKTGAIEGSVGAPLEGVGLSVRDGGGREVPAGQDGDVFIRTPHLMAGTLDYETSAVTPAARDAWFPTGDIGRLSADGLLSITGRKKDLIIRAGLNVSPTAIENVLLEHGAVEQAAVVGVPSELLGEDIVAVVKAKPGADRAAAQASLESFCKASFTPATRPSFVLLRDEFPCGVTGKVLKNALRDWAAGQLGAGAPR